MRVLAARTSDHKPLLVNFESSPAQQKHYRGFKFEAGWVVEKYLHDVIQEAWVDEHRTEPGRIHTKLEHCCKVQSDGSANNFHQLLSTSFFFRWGECSEGLHNWLEERVIANMNSQLLVEFKVEEVEVAPGQMHLLKSPGPDGLGACFF